jgi:TonB family protein
MIINPGIRCLRSLAVLAAFASMLFPASADARKFDVQMDTSGVVITAVEQPAPGFPEGKMRRGQEGWVRLNFVVGPDGQAVDPIIVDSTGGALFEQSALEVVDAWMFQAPEAGVELANNTVDVRFEIEGERDRATRNFLRRFRGIVHDLYYVNLDKAREQVNMANEFGGWNLYELTMLALLNARVEGAEGDTVEQLEYYRRALAISNRTALDGKERREVLGNILELEIGSQQYGAALVTLEALRAEPGSDGDLAELAELVSRLESSTDSVEPIVANATIYNPCNCDAGEPLWSYAPMRRSFSFDELNGNVERFEARCENNRISAQVETGTKWSLPADWGSCRVFVFGDDAATFEFIEHGEDTGDNDVGRSAVASSDVLD